jgi:beta-fructofuranosidase
VIDGEPTFFYTGVRDVGDALDQSVLRATAGQELDRITTDPGEPLLSIDPSVAGTHGQRDPFLVRREEDWLMLLGTGLPDGRGGAVAAWSSADTRQWTYQGVLFTQPAGGLVETGPVWECPQLVRIDGRWVLLVAVQMPAADGVICLQTVWFLGTLDGERFFPQSIGVLDAGDVFYAPAVASHDDRTLVWGWIQESPALREAGARDFAGALSTPRELFINDSTVGVRPAAELTGLWGTGVSSIDSLVFPDAIVPVGSPGGSSFRVRVVCHPQPGTTAGVVLWNDGNGLPVAVALSESGIGTRTLHAGRLSDPTAVELPFSVEVPATCSTVEVHVDVSIVEVFADGRSITFRVDPELDPGPGARLFARGGPVRAEAEIAPFRLHGG